MAAEAIGALRAELSANTAQFEKDMARAASTVLSTVKKLEGAGRQFTAIGSSLSNVGRSLTLGLTVPLAAAAVAAGKTAISFESAFAGVKKTLGDSIGGDELEKLSQGLRDLTKEIPMTAEGLAGIAEAGGALGVAPENILEFTRVVAGMASATNLTADQAANDFARIANVTGLPQTQFENLGSTIVALGNKGASTETEITAMALRVSAAGTLAGLSVPQILGFSAALSDVGLEAEAGGTAFSRLLKEMQKAVVEGGDQLDRFALLSGKSAAQFQKDFRDDASGSMRLFLSELGKLGGEGALGALRAFGIEEIRTADAASRLALAGDKVGASVDLAGKAFVENTALQTEVAARYATTESRLKILGEQFRDVARQVGEILGPAINALIVAFQRLLPVLNSLIQGFKGLPQWAQVAAGIGLVSAALAGPMLFAMGSVALRIGELVKLFGLLARVPSGAIAGLFGVNGAIGALGNTVPVLTARLALMDVGTKLASANLLGLGPAAAGAGFTLATAAGAIALTGTAAVIAGGQLLAYGDKLRGVNDPTREAVREVGFLSGAWVLLGDALSGAAGFFSGLAEEIARQVDGTELLAVAWEAWKVSMLPVTLTIDAIRTAFENLSISASWLGDQIKRLGDELYRTAPSVGTLSAETRDLMAASKLTGRTVTDWGEAQRILSAELKKTSAAARGATDGSKEHGDADKAGADAAKRKADALAQAGEAAKKKKQADEAAAAAAKAHAAEIQKLADALTGRDIAAKYAQLVEAVNAAGGVARLTAPALAQLGKDLDEMGKSGTASWLGLAAAAEGLNRLAAAKAALRANPGAPINILGLGTPTSLAEVEKNVAAEGEAAARKAREWRAKIEAEPPTKFWSADPKIQKELEESGGKLFGTLTEKTFDWGKALEQLTNTFQALGVSADNVLAKVAVGLTAGLAAGQQFEKLDLNKPGGKASAALLGINVAAGAMKQGVLGGAASMAAFGASVGSVIPGVGTAVGAIGGALVGGLLGLFGGAKKAREEMEKMRAEFIQSQGGMAALVEKAATAKVSLEALFSAKSAQALQAAIGNIKTELDTWNDAHKALQEAIDHYGLTVDELGPKFRDQKLEETALEIFQRWKLLKDSGADMVAVLAKMGPETNAWLQSTIKAGNDIPIAMKPVLLDLARAGQLTKENGEAYTEAEVEGMSFAKTMSEMWTELITKLDLYLSKILGIPANVETNVHTNYTESGSPGNNAKDMHGADVPGFAKGGIADFGSGSLIMAHGQEAIIPLDSPASESLGLFGDKRVAGLLESINATLAGQPRLIARAVRDGLILAPL